MGESFTWQVNDQLACCCWHSRIQWPSRIATASYSGSGESLALDVSSIVVRDVHDIRTGGLTKTQDYDLYNDQALPNLQAATNEAGTDRYRALRLR